MPQASKRYVHRSNNEGTGSCLSRIDSLREELRQKQADLDSMIAPEEYKARAETIRHHWQRVLSGFDTMEEMPWQNRKYLIDQMFDGADDKDRPFGVYVRNVRDRVIEYEI